MGMFDTLYRSKPMPDGHQTSDGYQTKALRNKLDQYDLDSGALRLAKIVPTGEWPLEGWSYQIVDKIIPITSHILCWANFPCNGKQELFEYRLHLKFGVLTQIDPLGFNSERDGQDWVELDGENYWDFLKEDK